MATDLSWPTGTQIWRYLRFHNWEEHEPGQAGAWWDHGDTRIGIPRQFTDYAIRDVVERLAEHEQVSATDMAATIRHLHFDVTVIRVLPAATYSNTAPLTMVSNLLSAAYRMLSAAASSAIKPRAVIGGRQATRISELLKKIQIDHFKRGTFDIPVLIPLPIPTSLEPDNIIQQYEPYERRVLRTFSDAIGTLKHGVVQAENPPEDAELMELVERGVSSNFCSAVADILDSPEVESFDTSVNWAPTFMPRPASIERLSIPSEASESIRATGKELAQQNKEPSHTISGPIVELRHEEGDSTGTITLSTILDGRSQEVRVVLPVDHYRRALRWHDSGLTVLAEGRIQSTHRKKSIPDPTRCEPIDNLIGESDHSA